MPNIYQNYLNQAEGQAALGDVIHNERARLDAIYNNILQRDPRDPLDRPKEQNRFDNMNLELLEIEGGGFKGFAPDFDNLNDIEMRLNRSIILAGNDPVFVKGIYQYKDDFAMSVYHPSPKKDGKFIFYKQQRDKLDLRGPSPGYVRHRGRTWYLKRVPARQQRQGLSRENSSLTAVNKEDQSRINDLTAFTHDVLGRKVTKWDEFIQRILNEGITYDFPLTEHVAVYRKDDNIYAEFKSRFLGAVKDDEVLLQEEDYDKSWIKKALKTAGLGVAHA